MQGLRTKFPWKIPPFGKIRPRNRYQNHNSSRMALMAQEKFHALALLQCVAGPPRRYLPDAWIESAGGLATRVAAFPPLIMVWCMIRQARCTDPSCRATLSWLQSARTDVGLLLLSSDASAYGKARRRLSDSSLSGLALRMGEY